MRKKGEISFPDCEIGRELVLTKHSQVKTVSPDQREGNTSSNGFFSCIHNFFSLRDVLFTERLLLILQKVQGYKALADLASNLGFLAFKNVLGIQSNWSHFIADEQMLCTKNVFL